MNLKERVLEELEKYPPEYRKIDPLIKPLCELLTENGYVTMHSCSSHVKSVCYPNYDIYEQKFTKGFFKKNYKKNQWYVLFVAFQPIENIKLIMDQINEKYQYNIVLLKLDDIRGITDRWSLNYQLEFNYNDEFIYNLNKNIYLEFKNYFKEFKK